MSKEVFFNSARPLGRCENITSVWYAYDGPKRFAVGGYIDVSHRYENIIITDEFVRNKRDEQVIVMIAHGITGGKLYGNDQKQGQFLPGTCELVDYYIVSGDAGIPIGASAAGIPEERCLPLGMPRTDAYFGHDKGWGNTIMAKRNRAYLYVPTFRSAYNCPTPKINYRLLDSLMEFDEILIVKRHYNQRAPLMEEDLVHVWEVGCYEPSARYLFDCDVLATDFSSILFDGYLMGKPSVLTADAKDPYLEERGMYYRYPDEYGSRSIAVAGNEERFLTLLREAADNGMQETERACIERVASACDGHAIERLIKFVKELA